MRAFLFICGLLSGLLMAVALPAQERAATVTIHVRTRLDSIGSPIPVPDAEVAIKAGKVEQTMRADQDGVARFTDLPAGLMAIRVRAIGAAPRTIDVRIEAGRNEFTVILDRQTVTLGEVRIVGDRPVSGMHEDFELRRITRAANAIVTREDIEKIGPIDLSQMIRRLPGVQVADSLGTRVLVSSRGLKWELGKPVPCVLRVAIDGVVSPRVDIDQIPPRDVYGVELFLGPARIPLQMGGLRRDQICGLLAIWTRRQ